MRFWPRTIRWQIILGLTAVEVISIGLFAVLLIEREQQAMRQRAVDRLTYQTRSISLLTTEALQQQRPDRVPVVAENVG